MSGPERPRALLLGVGNIHRRDDGIGPALARALAPRLAATHTVTVERGDDPLRLIAAWETHADVTVLDAALSATPPGTVCLHDGVPAGAGGDGRVLSAHGLGVAGAASLSAVLGSLPKRFSVITVAGADFSHGERLSARLASRFPGLVEDVIALLRQRRSADEGI